MKLIIAFRAEIAERQVKPMPVVEGPDVVEEISPCLIAIVIRAVMHPLALQRAKGTLRRSIVMPGAEAVHADVDPPISQYLLEVTISVLTAAIRMRKQARTTSCWWPAILSAFVVKSLVIRSDIAQPTTRRLYRSSAAPR
jgi:hypothetical protein